MNKIIIMAIFGLMLVVACEKNNQLIGGQKDEHGCLVGAGYSWNETIGACVRGWELDESQAKAAQLVIAPMSARPITVVSVETLKCPGCFIVTLQSPGSDKTYPVKVMNWQISYEITNFEECVAAGNPVMESYPRQCAAGNKTFTEEIKHTCTNEESLNKACTLDYTPVCGEIVLNSGKTIYQTFGNGCSACATMKVVGYTPGECGDKESSITYISTSKEECSKMGVWLCDEGYSLFSDDTGCGCMKIEKTNCGTCPLLSQPSPDFCKDGKIIAGEKDECGCTAPPKCEPVVCTMDAKACPDGSYVGRTAPDCEFSPCPGEK